MEAYRREVGARLRELRRARNWSQEDAAHAVGVTSATWGRWERGRTSPYDHNWQKIEDTFGVDVAAIRGHAPAPLGLGENHHDPLERRLDELLERVSGLDEQMRLLRAEFAAAGAEAQKRTEASATPTPRSQQRRRR